MTDFIIMKSACTLEVMIKLSLPEGTETVHRFILWNEFGIVAIDDIVSVVNLSTMAEVWSRQAYTDRWREVSTWRNRVLITDNDIFLAGSWNCVVKDI